MLPSAFCSVDITNANWIFFWLLLWNFVEKALRCTAVWRQAQVWCVFGNLGPSFIKVWLNRVEMDVWHSPTADLKWDSMVRSQALSHQYTFRLHFADFLSGCPHLHQAILLTSSLPICSVSKCHFTGAWGFPAWLPDSTNQGAFRQS